MSDEPSVICTATTTLLHSNGRWPSDVVLWHVQVPLTPSAWNLLQTWLTVNEQRQALRYQLDADRLRFAATRAVLRTLLARHTGAVPLSLRFSLGAFGRPELDGYRDTLSFNVTHTGQHALIALSERRCVGIDIEHIERVIAWRALLRTVCTAPEQRMLLGSGPMHGFKGFLRCWTAKEAVLKALGVGVRYGLQKVSIDLYAYDRQHIKAPLSDKWNNIPELQLYWIDDLVSYLGCIAFGPAGSVNAYTSS
ncbi:4'-phosphopantetheinyl transferase family protein [Candidatus Vallotia tarda]|uniref:4'-phosphopantetheinyl transferase n=1 Tax=Candidatus Vallotiella hemipterorum TaxID=1177213 RepID=A0A8D9CCH7_9BURK|nr:4'-phosphopantetheinyl transferase superfamily protein [Candidatus Vallotia tarda]CAD6506727.1 4'-phosphopantetheinyl transferase [Candidatus Vallotia tarda]CAG7605382.1 4'-phosphopantetheinyl transferase [Candidatus Vallotia tarda]